MGAKVRRSRSDQNVMCTVIDHRLKSIAGTALETAVIDY